MTELLIISEDIKDLRKIRRLIKTYNSTSVKVITWRQDTENYSKRPPFEIAEISQYINLVDKKEEQLAKIALGLIDQLRNCPVGESTFERIFKAEDLSLIDIISPLAFLYSFGPMVKTIELAKTILNIEKPKKIILIWHQDIFSKILKELAEKDKLEFHCFLREKKLLLILKEGLKSFLRPIVRELVFYIKIVKASTRRLVIKKENVKNEKNKLLFLNSTLAQLRGVLPIIKIFKIDFRNIIEVILPKTSRSLRILRKENINYRVAEDFLDCSFIYSIKAVLKQNRENWLLTESKNSYLEKLQYENVSVWKFFKPVFLYLLFNPFRTVFEDIKLATYILDKGSPKIVVYSDEIDLFSRALLLLAKRKQIPTLRIQYGEVGSFATDWFYCLADRIAVSGEKIKENLVRLGISPERITIVGQSRFDDFSKMQFDKNKIIEKFKLVKDKKIILFASTYYSNNIAGCFGSFLTPQEYTLWLREVYSALREFSGFQVIVKPHHNPYDPIRLHRRILRQLGAENKIRIFSPRNNIGELIAICDLLISWDSTVISKAVCMGKPVVVVNLSGRPDKLPSVKARVALGSYKKEDIIPMVKIALEDRDFRERLKEAHIKFIKDYLYQRDGKSAERVAKLILEMSPFKDEDITRAN